MIDATVVKKLNESGLARIWSLASDPQRDFLIGTTDRHDDLDGGEGNHMRFQSLIARIKQLGLGYFPLQGHYVETSKKGERQPVQESSLFVSGPKKL